MATLREFNIGCERKGIIYSITNTITSKIYIGSTDLFFKRKSSHIRQLEQNKHHSIHLQRSYNKYGEKAFEFDVLQEVEKRDDLIFYEQKWIDLTKSSFSKFGYNILPNAKGTFGRIVSKEEKNIRSIAAKKWASKPENKKRLSDYNKSIGKKIAVNFYDKRKDEFTFPYQKIDLSQAKQIFELANKKVKHKQIALMFNISQSMVSLIASGKRWPNLNSN